MNFYSRAVAANPALAWQGAVCALQDAGGRDVFLLGFGPEPVFVRESALHGHAYIVGSSNSGKTSRILSPLATQLIQAGHPMWVVDCKLDPLLWGHIRDDAQRAGRKAHFFSLQPGIPSSFSIDFFEAVRDRSPRQIAELLVGSLGLNKAAEPFFISQNMGALRLAIQQASAKGKVSFRAIAHELRGLTANPRFAHAIHALDVLESLADVPELNPPKSPKDPPAIDFVRLVEDGSVCYFCLPVSTELKLTSAATASLLLKLTSAVSKDLAIQGKRSRRIYFAIDEFQDVASAADLAELMAQVRGVGAGISLILLHQVQEQVADEGLRALLKSASVLVLLSPRPFLQELQEWSGEKTEWLRSEGWGVSNGGGSSQESWNVGYSEMLRPALDTNLIQDVAALPGAGFVVVQGSRPRPLFFPHHVPRHVADQRSRDAFRLLAPQPQARLTTTAAAPNNQGAQPARGRPPRAATTHPPTMSPAAPAKPQPQEVRLSSRLQKLFLRLGPKTLLSKVRGVQ